MHFVCKKMLVMKPGVNSLIASMRISPSPQQLIVPENVKCQIVSVRLNKHVRVVHNRKKSILVVAHQKILFYSCKNLVLK